MARTPQDRTYLEVNGRRSYGARLTGTHPRTNYVREWVHRRQSLRGQRGLWVEIGPTPGWYEVATYTHAGAKQRTYYAYPGPGEQHQESPPPPKKALTGPPPGKPGAWNGETCRCGKPVEHYTLDGFPRCETHHDRQDKENAT